MAAQECSPKTRVAASRVFTQNRPGSGQISGFGLPLTDVTKNSN